MLDPLTLDQLRILAAIADTGSFTAGAKRVQRAQSAVSQSIRALEATLRLTLFDRSSKVPVLTEAGRAVLADARRLIEGADRLRARAEAMVRGLEAELTLAVDQLFPRELGMAVMRALQKEFPLLPVRLLTGGIGAPERYLRAGLAEMAVYALEVTGATDLDTEFLMDVEMVPVVSAEHPLARLDGPLGREALQEHVQLVLTDTTQVGDGGFTRGIVGPRVWRFADMSTRLEYLRGGFGWCNMPLHAVAADLHDGRLKRLRLVERDGFSVALHVVHRRAHAPGLAARWMIGHVRGLLAEGVA